MAAIFQEIRRFLFKLYKNKYKGVFKIADYDSEVENKKLKISDSIWRTILTEFDVFLPVRLKMHCTKCIYKEFSDCQLRFGSQIKKIYIKANLIRRLI